MLKIARLIVPGASADDVTNQAERSLRVLVIAQGALENEKTWSGIPGNMVRYLRGDVSVLEMRRLSALVQALDRHLHTIILKVTKTLRLPATRFHLQDHTLVAKMLGWLVAREANRQSADMVLGLSCTNYIAYIPGHLPVAHVTGSTFSAISQTPGYLDYAQCPRFMIDHYRRAEAAAAARVSRFIVPAAAGFDDLVGGANIQPENISIIPYGPNLDEDRARAMRDSNKVATDRCDLLFFGGDWERKGGSVAAETTSLLHSRGVMAHLHVVGPKKVPDLDCPNTVYGHLSKSADGDLISKLFSTSFLLFVPSRSELFGVVFREAACFGLPSVAYSIGGVADAVKSGTSGKLLDGSATSEDFAMEIEKLWLNRSKYEHLRETTAKFYDDHCSWSRWSSDMSRLMRGVVQGSSNVEGSA